MNAFGLAPLLLILPLIGVLFNGIVGRHLVAANPSTGEKWSGWFATSMSGGAFLVAVLIFFSLGANGHHAETVVLWDWFNMPSTDFHIQWAMYFDTLSSTMLLVITGVGSLIHIYAIGYMHGDKDFHRFFTYLNLFLFFMLILVTGNNYLMLFVGWEGVGLCSFLLIGFWFDKPGGAGVENGDAARKAFVANRVGDFAMILAMSLTFWTFASLEYETVTATALEMFESGQTVSFGMFEAAFGSVLTWITLLFLIGATGKSAQIPLFIWLPDAMAGPTPVSALIHAATMVTSGIYLITRSNVLFEIVRQGGQEYAIGGVITTPDLVAVVGACTAVYAGLVAFTQFDVKKVLAYSTVSQLGFMIAAVGMGAYVAGMFHLITHAFFKALLFMGSGSIIHGMEHGHHHVHDHGHGGHDDHGDDSHAAEDHHDDFDPQDMRTMGGLRKKMPVTFGVYVIGSLALAGIFPFAGFWSKDEILAHASYNDFPLFGFISFMLTIGAFCTAFYMTRQIKMVFFGEPRHEAAEHASESNRLMTRPLVFLAVLSLVGGFLNTPYMSEAAYKLATYGSSYGADDHSDDGYDTESSDHSEGELMVSAEGSKDTFNLALEHWLEHSIQSFELTDEGVVTMPYTPTWLQFGVAIQSSIVALFAIALAWFVVFRDYPKNPEEEDPLQKMPIIGTAWAFFGSLPFDRLYMNGWVKNVFHPVAVLSDKIDWDFWHDFVHNHLIRDTFVTAADFFSSVLDPKGVDGVVNGVGKSVREFANGLRTSQTGNVGNYALGLFLGVAVMIAYFIFAS